ncbi:hypothetical protein KAW18_14215 [candidate division WOR-3 bacterium]|nr:hypothetical protein [candidate division WOR-3 bacterium]
MSAYPGGHACVIDEYMQNHHMPCDGFENLMNFEIPLFMLQKLNGIVKAASWYHLFKGRINDYNLSLTEKQAIQKAKENNHA